MHIDATKNTFSLILLTYLFWLQLLTQLKGNMEEENRHLAEQNQSLLKENRALLEQSLERRDQHYSQQREYQSVHAHIQIRSLVSLGILTRELLTPLFKL